MNRDRIEFKTIDSRNAEEFFKKRAFRIEKFFNQRGIPVQLKGSEENPMIVLFDGMVLSAYVHNFELRFVDRPDQGDLIESIKLTWDNVNNYPLARLIEILKEGEQTAGYRIRIKGTEDLFLCGYAHKERDKSILYDKKELFPVFGKLVPHVHKSREMAEEILEKIQNDYPVELNQWDGFGSFE